MSVLQRAVSTRMPQFTPEMSPRERAEALADHILETARVRGELAELRMNAHVQLRDDMQTFRELDGWERYKRRSGDRTREAEHEAKRRMDPELVQRIEDAKFTIARATEEMDRLGGSDYDAASRAYTILTGG